jgi:hypothetical protein
MTGTGFTGLCRLQEMGESSWSGRHGLKSYTRCTGTRGCAGSVRLQGKGKGTIERRSIRITLTRSVTLYLSAVFNQCQHNNTVQLTSILTPIPTVLT